MFVLTADQMKAADGYAIRTMGIPGVTLMGSAAQGIAETIHEMSPGARRAVMVCGSGNNGGDGLALAGILALQGADVSVVLASARALSEDAAYYFNRLPEQVRTLRFADDGEQCLREIAGADVVVDALYGTGFRGSLTGAAAELAEIGLVLQVSDTQYSEEPPGTILTQEPEADSSLRSGDTVSVVVSAGPESAQVPALVGLSLDDARRALQRLGLQVGEIFRDEESSQERDTVLHQDPQEGEVLQNGESVNLPISAPPLLRSVPRVVGEDLTSAQALIEEAGLTLGTIHEESATGVAVGTVFAQSPEAGQQMRSGDAVEIWVARELVMATGTYPLTLEIEQDDSVVTIFLQEEGFYREVSTMNCDRGTLEVELNLESETPGEKTLIVFVNDEEAARDTVTLRVEEDEE